MQRRGIVPLSLLALLCAPVRAAAQEVPKPLELSPAPVVAPYIPFPQLPAPPLEERLNGIGLAQQLTRAKKLQARVLWIDATANLAKINSGEKIEALVDKIKKTGFNTIVLDVKPIVGYTLYPSKLAPQLIGWRDGAAIPPDFDPVAEFVKDARAAGLQLVASMNAFSEGHQHPAIRDTIGKNAPGFQHPEWQTVLYEPEVRVTPLPPKGGGFRIQTVADSGPAQAGYSVSSESGIAPNSKPVSSPFRGQGGFPLMDAPNKPSRDERVLAVYTELAGFKPTAGSLVALVAADGRVLAQVDGAALAAVAPTLPAGAGALVGRGAAADFLRQAAQPGTTLVFDTAATYVPISQRPDQQYPLMVNPNSPAVQQRLRDMLTELLTKYALDGVIFDDRMRYAGLNADFSESTRAAFEKWLGKPVHWPDDVFHYEVSFPSMARRVIPGPLLDDWQTWRALTIRNWLASTVALVKGLRPNATVSSYSGSWYGEYPRYGANWAAADFTAGFPFLTPTYQKTGFAGLLDWITTGCYYPNGSIAEAIAAGRVPGASIEAAGELSNRAANDQAFVYAGISLEPLTGKPESLKSALQAACASTQGVMVFDLSHFDYKGNEGFWDVFAQAFSQPAVAPHTVPGLLAQLRRDHAARKAAGILDPPVVFFPGVPGTGF